MGKVDEIYEEMRSKKEPGSDGPKDGKVNISLTTKLIVYGTLVLAVILIIGLLNPFVIVGAGQRGVITTFGAVQNKVLGEGLHFRIPFIQQVVKMDVQIQKTQTEAAGASKDLQDVHMTVALNHHIIPEMAPWVFQVLSVAYGDRIIAPTIQEVVKAVAAKYTAVDLITQREKVRQEMKLLLRNRLAESSIKVDDMAIVNFKFSKGFTQAIEAKQMAEQLALKAQRDLERVKIEAEQKVTQAKAEAEGLRVQKANITPELLRLRQIEVTMKAVEKWDGHMPKITGNVIPFIDVEKTKLDKQ